MEGVESALFAGIEGSGLAAVEQRAKHAGLVHLHLGGDGQHGVVPDPLSETCCCCFANAFVQFRV